MAGISIFISIHKIFFEVKYIASFTYIAVTYAYAWNHAWSLFMEKKRKHYRSFIYCRKHAYQPTFLTVTLIEYIFCQLIDATDMPFPSS